MDRPFDLFSTIRRSAVLIIATTLLGMLGGVVATWILPREYESSSDVFVSLTAAGASANDLSQGSDFVQSRIRSYAAIVDSPLVLEPVIERLDLSSTVEQLARSIEAAVQLDTVIITITATGPTAAEARSIAAAVVESLADAVDDVEASAAPASSGPAVSLVVTRTAELPDGSSRPSLLLDLALGAVLGLAVGLGVAVLRARLRRSVVTEDDFADLVGPTADLGTVESDSRLATGEATEDIRRLRGVIAARVAESGMRSLLIAPVAAGSGATTIARGLARSFAATGIRVCLVEGDLRAPSIAKLDRTPPSDGLAGALLDGRDLKDLIVPLGDAGLHLLPAGRTIAASGDLLGSPRARDLLQRLAQHYDLVLVDAPPALELADAALLAPFVDGYLVVAAPGGTSRADFMRARELLATAGGHSIGAVLNQVGPRSRRRSVYAGA